MQRFALLFIPVDNDEGEEQMNDKIAERIEAWQREKEAIEDLIIQHTPKMIEGLLQDRSFTEVSHKTGVSAMCLCDILEHERHPTIDVFLKINRFYREAMISNERTIRTSSTDTQTP